MPTAGERYSLTCTLFGAMTTTYQWMMNDAVLQENTTMMLSFSTFKLSDAGHYSCNVTVDDTVYKDDLNVTLKSMFKCFNVRFLSMFTDYFLSWCSPNSSFCCN